MVDGSGNPLFGVVGISAGENYTVYLKNDGTVWAVGYNSSGQLGDGTTTDRTNPVQVVDGSGNPLSGVVGVSAGVNHTVYLHGGRHCLGSGFQWFRPTGGRDHHPKQQPGTGGGWIGKPLSGVVGISAGKYHTVYLKGDGTVWAVGSNSFGKLGDGTTTDSLNPVQVVDGSGNPLSGAMGISAGFFHTVYLKGDGTVWAVGYNPVGQLGNGTTRSRINPVQVVDGSGNPLSWAVGISAGFTHTVYLKSGGTVLAAGGMIMANWGTGPLPTVATRYRWWMDQAIR